MLTKQDIKQIDSLVENRLDRFSAEVLTPAFEQVATKEDLRAFATKEDLRAFATKEWCLETLATKDDLKPFATKDWVEQEFYEQKVWLKERFDMLAQQINANQEKFYKLVYILHEDKKILDRKNLRAIARA